LARLLVTGASGFIGAPLVRALEAGNEIKALRRADGDIALSETLVGIRNVDHVFHLAGRSFVPDSWRDPASFVNTNVGGTTAVLDFCRRVGASMTFVSAYVYGQPDRLPIDETHPVRPSNPYAVSKYLAEQVCAFYASQLGVRTTVVRPFNIYGPRQPGHFLIPTVVRQLKNGGPIRVLDLAPRRDYLYVDDLVDLLVRTLDPNQSDYTVVNAGSGSSVSVGELVDRLQTIAGTSLEVLSEDKPRHQELNDVRAAVAKARDCFGWMPRTSLEDGLKRLLAVA
jgi:GDP-4-dehydro-6-deoxy-D-mannose reductase